MNALIHLATLQASAVSRPVREARRTITNLMGNLILGGGRWFTSTQPNKNNYHTVIIYTDEPPCYKKNATCPFQPVLLEAPQPAGVAQAHNVLRKQTTKNNISYNKPLQTAKR